MMYEVWNKHPNGYTHREKFRGDDIVIKANDFVLMEYEDAVQFKGQYFPMKMNGEGQPDPTGYKVIHLVPHSGEAKKAAVVEYISPVDGRKFNSQKELDAYLISNFGDQVYSDPMLDRDLETAAKIKGK